MTTPLDDAFIRLQAAAHSQPAPDADQRRERLARLKALVLDNRDAIIAAISGDFGGRAKAETELLEIVPLIQGLNHGRARLRRWMRDERRPVSMVLQPARSWVRYEPLGVIGIISPWNYPLLLALSPLVDALAAGNRAMIKPSELTPAFADLLAALVGRYFTPDEVVVVTGGVEVAEAFCALAFNHLVFTGSTSIGRRVMRAAAENLTPVTLELGGKSPAIVCPDYPIEKAANAIAFGKFVNAGQTCIAPDYGLVPAESAEAFAQAVLKAALRGYPTLGANDDYSHIITPRHQARLTAAVEQARAAGATILTHPGADSAGGKFPPTVVLNAPADSVLLTEEIFGPVLPVVGYTSLREAIAFAGQRDRPLALYCFSDDPRAQTEVLNGVQSGGVTLNGTLLHIAQHDLPFGGIGPSGSGAYHGQDGFRRFSHARAVHKIGIVNPFQRIGPPWGEWARWAGRVLGR